MKTLSIIIVNWRSKRLLKQCLQSIEKNIGTISYEIIVVDNNSRDGSHKMISRDFSYVIVRVNKINSGFSKAVNQGIKISHGNNILILNPDIIVKKDSIRYMLSKLKSDENIGAVGPKIFNKNKKIWPYVQFPSITQIFLFHTAIKRFTLRNNYLMDRFLIVKRDINKDKNNEVELIPGGCLMVKKEIIEKIGLMDERFSLWFEDTDFCLRVKKNGWKLVWEPRAEMIHLGSGSTRKLPLYEYLNTFYTNMFKYFKKHKGHFYASITILIMIINMTFGSILSFFLSVVNFNKKKIYSEEISVRLKLAFNWSGLIIRYSS